MDFRQMNNARLKFSTFYCSPFSVLFLFFHVTTFKQPRVVRVKKENITTTAKISYS